MITYQKVVAFKPPDESFWMESGSNASANSSILSLFPEILLEANGAELHDSCTFFLKVSLISSIFFRFLFSIAVLISLHKFSSISLRIIKLECPQTQIQTQIQIQIQTQIRKLNFKTLKKCKQ